MIASHSTEDVRETPIGEVGGHWIEPCMWFLLLLAAAVGQDFFLFSRRLVLCQLLLVAYLAALTLYTLLSR